MRPSELVALKRDTVDRSLQTISNRINQLGLTEPTVQQYGQAGTDFEILVELPGVDDPARVEEIMQTTAQLEITDVKDGPFQSRDAALGAKGRHSAAEHQAGHGAGRRAIATRRVGTCWPRHP